MEHNQSKSFVHLHVHPHYSILDGMSTIPGLIEKSIEQGVNAIALTDHGNMFGIKEFYNYASEKNQPINNEIDTLQKQLVKTSLPTKKKKTSKLKFLP